MNVVIIGCGLIGKKRAVSLSPDDKLVACCDINAELAQSFADQYVCKAYTNIKLLLKEVDFDGAVIAVVNKYAANIIKQLLDKGKHVLAEKPLGRNKKESENIIQALLSARKIHNKHINLKTGFNHRFHPAIWKAKELIDKGTIGELLYIRAKYGHGGRPGMEKEWRASKDLCGGGELLDQGVHIIDLCNWFSSDIQTVYGKVVTKFWDMEVEDNAFFMLESKSGVNMQCHVSWTNWRNTFNFELFGSDGYIYINGLGGSYGTESLELGIRKKEGGKPEIQVEEFPGEDKSWHLEWAEFVRSIIESREPIGNGFDGLVANGIIQAIYSSSLQNKPINISLDK